MATGEPKEHDRLVVVSEPGQYVLHLDGDIVGWALYSVADGVMTVPHVETVPRHRGKDFAARLMRGVLDDARARGLRVLPRCGYAAAYMRQRPSTLDLLATT